MFIYFYPAGFYISLIILALVLVVLHLQGKSIFHIISSAVFGVYLISAISVAVFPFVIDFSNQDFRLNLNLIPFDFGSCFDYLPQNCVKAIFNNILLTIPFGFGIHFITHVKLKNVLWLTVVVGCSFEFTQFVMGLVFHAYSRSIDINDVILNATGFLFGHGIFRVFAVVYPLIIQKLQRQPRYIFAYIYDVVRNQN
jgi:glycopeptide antibiotics resistance protein